MTPAALVLYFDGSCPLCVDQMQRLRGRDAHRRLGFVDIAAAGFDPAPLGMELAAMNREMHSRTADGRVLVGIDCMLAAYTLVGRGWRVWPLRVPGLRGVFAAMYRLLARNRHAVSRRLGYRLPPACDNGGCALHGNPFLKNEAPAGEASGMAPPAAVDRGPRRSKRDWIVTWMYAAAIAHLLVGALLPWLAGSSLLDGYRQGIEAHFWPGAAPAEARLQQQWWLALFGATVQCAGVWMLALVHLGNRLRQRAAWGWLLAGLLLWAPQDMLISWQARVGSHLVADAAALLLMVPPLLWLWKEDHA